MSPQLHISFVDLSRKRVITLKPREAIYRIEIHNIRPAVQTSLGCPRLEGEYPLVTGTPFSWSIEESSQNSRYPLQRAHVLNHLQQA